MGKKPWLQYPPSEISGSACGVVKSICCQLNRGIGCTCGKWNSSVVMTEKEKEIARNFDVKKAIEEALRQQKISNV